MNKDEARALMLKKNAELSDFEKIFADEKIENNLLYVPEYIDAVKVFVYCGVGDEVKTDGIIKRLFADGKRVFVPLCYGSGEMDAVEIDSLSDVVKGRYGIPEPIDNSRKISPSELDMIIVPGIAFGEDGTRLGRGAGYYDRYIEKAVNAKLVALCRTSNLLPTVPHEAHDKAVDVIVTDTKILKRKVRKEEEKVAVSKKKSNRFLLVYIAFILGVSMLLSAWLIMTANEVLALARPDNEVIIKIPEDASHGDVAKLLKKNDVIEHRFVFTIFANMTKKGIEYAPGEYKVNSNMDYRAMLRRLTSRNGALDTVTITIPEGYELDQIIKVLSENGVCDEKTLKSVAANVDFDYEFLEGIEVGKENRLEGYLFPDTYEFYKNDSAERVFKKFLDNFELKFNENMRERAKALDMSVHELITLASIVEREATAADRENISSVFHNRLKNPTYPYLESCATVQYILGERKKVISIADTKIDNPYNTYKYKGLPPGPIANPGLDAIEATLYPNDTSYLFFALQSDGTHKFSRTYEEHLKTPNLNP